MSFLSLKPLNHLCVMHICAHWSTLFLCPNYYKACCSIIFLTSFVKLGTLLIHFLISGVLKLLLIGVLALQLKRGVALA